MTENMNIELLLKERKDNEAKLGKCLNMAVEASERGEANDAIKHLAQATYYQTLVVGFNQSIIEGRINELIDLLKKNSE